MYCLEKNPWLVNINKDMRKYYILNNFVFIL